MQTTRRLKLVSTQGSGARTSNLSKITPPTLQRVHPNERLFARLDAAFQHRIVWVHGPPGAGKTTLAASYLAARKVSPLWYRLDEGDADPATLFFYLATAAARQGPEGRSPLPLLTPDFRGAVPLFTRRFFRELFSTPDASIIVFDDYHEVAVDALLQECLPHGLEEVPEGCHIIIISRTPPPPQLARLRLNGIVDVVEPGTLRMTLDEATGLAHARGADASAARVQQIAQRTQGWTAGLILMLEAGETRDVAGPLDAAPVPEVLFDYFAGEILQRMDARGQRMLCALSLMPAMTAASAERLTGEADAGALLDDLRKRNYFTSCDTADKPRYRFHPLFRDFLLETTQARVSGEDLKCLRIRAAAILDDDGQFDPAVGLLTSAGALDDLTALIKRRAKVLLDGGRNDTLVAWLAKLPEARVQGDAWLSYWRGTARVNVQPVDAYPHLQTAFSLFEQDDDVTGQFLAWGGLAEAVRLDSFGDMSRFDALIVSLHELLARHPEGSSPGVMLAVAAGMVTALSRRGDDRAEIEAWQDKARRLAEALGDKAASIRLGLAFVIIDLQDAKYAASRAALQALPDPMTLDHLPVAQWAGLIAHMVAMEYRQISGDLEAFGQEALRRLEAAGFILWMPLIASQLARHEIRRGNLAGAKVWLARAAVYSDRVSGHRAVHYHYIATQLNIATGDFAAARAHAEDALLQARKGGWLFFEAISLRVKAQFLCAAGEFDAVDPVLDKVDDLLARSMSGAAAFSCKLLRAEVRFALGDDIAGRAWLAEAMALARSRGDRHADLSPGSAARLCALALKFDIETVYVRSLIRLWDLRSPDPHEESWPWPLIIRTLGALSILKDGEPLTFSRKTPKRLIALLKAIVAHGGRDVPDERLIDAVWPDEEGDAAQSSLRIAIHRLRKLLGDNESILVSGGRIGLNAACCWLDTWTLDHLLLQDGNPVDDGPAGEESARRSARIFALYRGDFLAADEDIAGATQRRDQLRRRFVRFVRAQAEEQATPKAISILQRGLDATPEAEDLHLSLLRLRGNPDQATRAPASEAVNRKLPAA